MTTAFPDRATLHSVLDVAARAPSLRNLQPWRWRVEAHAVHLYADWTRRSGDAPSDRRDVLLGCGAVLDHCAVALAAAGWRPRVRRMPGRGDGSPLAILEVVEQPACQAHLELASAISLRRADRRNYASLHLPEGALELLYVRAARLGVELGVVPRSRWARLTDGTVALRHPAGVDEPADGAVLVVLGTREDDDAARLRAGEALSHLALTVTALGLASCPVTQPLNDMRGRLTVACEVFDGESHPQALMRVGIASPGGDDGPVTPRRPVHDTTTWSVGS